MPPRSVAELNQWLTDLAVESGHPEKGRALRKNLATAIIAQMLPKDAYLKGGSAISLRYSLAESRLSRDVDSVFRGAKEHFLDEFLRNLREGWHGFTGEISEEQRKHLPEGIHFFTAFVALYYKNGRFAKVTFEASPESSAGEVSTEWILDEGMQELFSSIGFPVGMATMLGIDEQLAEKLDGVTNPDYPRGRDLRDIEVILSHHTPNLDALRAHIHNLEGRESAHLIRMVPNRSKERYRIGYREAGGTTFEHAWSLALRLIEQVDGSRVS